MTWNKRERKQKALQRSCWIPYFKGER